MSPSQREVVDTIFRPSFTHGLSLYQIMSAPISDGRNHTYSTDTVARVNTEQIYATGVLQYPALGRMMERADRGRELNSWALNPNRPDTASVMALDDCGFDTKTPQGVSGASLFPILSAIDSIVVIHGVLQRVRQMTPFNHHPVSVMSLCRTAFESSSQSIWILSPTDREGRRRRAAGASAVGAGQKYSHLSTELRAHDAKTQTIPEPYLAEMRNNLNFAKEELDKVKTVDSETASFSKMVTLAGKWLHTNPPPHLKAELGSLDLSMRIDQHYRICSSFTHGYNWATDFVTAEGIGGIAKMLADAIAVAVYVTESAVCLFEAQATNSGSVPPRHRNYPARLQPSVDAWTVTYA